MAMASSDPAPTVAMVEAQTNAAAPPAHVLRQQSSSTAASSEAAQMVMMRQQMDPAMRLLLEQQLSLCQQQQNILAGAPSQHRALLGNMQQQPTNQQIALQLEIMNAKQQQERMFQLQQLMTRNIQSQPSSNKRRNNFRASAA